MLFLLNFLNNRVFLSHVNEARAFLKAQKKLNDVDTENAFNFFSQVSRNSLKKVISFSFCCRIICRRKKRVMVRDKGVRGTEIDFRHVYN